MNKTSSILRFIASLLTVALLFAFLPTAAYAEDDSADIVATGNYANEYIVSRDGADVIWTFYRTGKLSISGNGNMPYLEAWESDFGMPWVQYRDDVINAVIEEGVGSIGHNAFIACRNLTTVYVGSTVDTIRGGAFFNCQSLREIWLPANLRFIGDDAFMQCPQLSTVHFAGTQEQWSSIRVGYNNEALLNANILFEEDSGTDDISLSTDSSTTAQSIAELTPVDYLAFAYLSYEDCVEGWTVYDYLGALWNEKWEDTDITYGELYAHVADWRVSKTKKNEDNGFYAVSFANHANEVVLAYRGSIPSDEWLGDMSDTINDWIMNDLPAIIRSTTNSKGQIPDAFSFFRSHAEHRTIDQIVVTGHSLGGALANIISAYSGCYGETFNAISAIDAAYINYPEMMLSFTGTDQWNYVDHVNPNDALAGAFDTTLKPHIDHTSLVDFGLAKEFAFSYHGMKTIIRRSESGELSLTEPIGDMYRPTAVTACSVTRPDSYFVLPGECYIILGFGTSESDRIVNVDGCVFKNVPNDVGIYTMGGDGSDTIFTSFLSSSDVLYGGAGDNNGLDGGAGNDMYYYQKGDGLLTVYDCLGSNTLRIYGYDEKEKFTEREQGEFTVLLDRSGKEIIRLHKGKTLKPMLSITEGYWEYPFGSTLDMQIRSVFRCPVNVEVLDKNGSVVLTLRDLDEQTVYTDYGYFYVFKDEDGEYTKVAELTKGYTLRAVGTGIGTMECFTQEYRDGEPIGMIGASQVPVTDSSIFELSKDGKLLCIDSNGDGKTDEKLRLNEAITVNLNCNGGICGYSAVYADFDGSIGALPTPVLAGYEFTGWYKSDGSPVDESTVFTKDCEITASWYSTKDDTSTKPQQTGNSTWLWIIVGLIIISSAIALTVLLRKRRSRRRF